MSKPAAAKYYIINRLLSPTGDKLAITYNGQGYPVTVTPMASSDAQKWSIVDYSDGKNQSVSPNGNTAIQAGPVSGFINGIPSNASVYWIRGGGGTPYTIHSGNNGTVNWALAQATNDTKVSWGDNVGYQQEWVLQAV